VRRVLLLSLIILAVFFVPMSVVKHFLEHASWAIAARNSAVAIAIGFPLVWLIYDRIPALLRRS
jgi:hypothetical protein